MPLFMIWKQALFESIDGCSDLIGIDDNIHMKR